MALAKQYYSSYKSNNNIDYYCEIWVEDFSGNASEISLGEGGPLIKYDTDSEHRFSSIISSSLELPFVVKGTGTQFFITQLRTVLKERQVYIHLYRATSSTYSSVKPLWSGFLIMDLGAGEDVFFPYEQKLTFVDGLSLLKDIDFVDLSSTLVPPSGPALNLRTQGNYLAENMYYGPATYIFWIREILKKTGASLEDTTGVSKDYGFTTAVNWYNGSMANTNQSSDPLALTKCNVSMFHSKDDQDVYNPLNCYLVLKELLRHWGARITYWKGEFWIVQIPEYITNETGLLDNPDNINSRQYSFTGAFLGSQDHLGSTYYTRYEQNLTDGQISKLTGTKYNYLPMIKEVEADYLSLSGTNYYGGFPYGNSTPLATTLELFQGRIIDPSTANYLFLSIPLDWIWDMSGSQLTSGHTLGWWCSVKFNCYAVRENTDGTLTTFYLQQNQGDYYWVDKSNWNPLGNASPKYIIKSKNIIETNYIGFQEKISFVDGSGNNIQMLGDWNFYLDIEDYGTSQNNPGSFFCRFSGYNPLNPIKRNPNSTSPNLPYDVGSTSSGKVSWSNSLEAVGLVVASSSSPNIPNFNAGTSQPDSILITTSPFKGFLQAATTTSIANVGVSTNTQVTNGVSNSEIFSFGTLLWGDAIEAYALGSLKVKNVSNNFVQTDPDGEWGRGVLTGELTFTNMLINEFLTGQVDVIITPSMRLTVGDANKNQTGSGTGGSVTRPRYINPIGKLREFRDGTTDPIYFFKRGVFYTLLDEWDYEGYQILRDPVTSTTINNNVGGNGGAQTNDPIASAKIINPTSDALMFNSPIASVSNSVASIGSNVAVNGNFNVAVGWSLGAGWSINTTTKRATFTATGSVSVLSQGVLTQGKPFQINFTINLSAGSLLVKAGTAGTSLNITSSGIYSIYLDCEGSNVIKFEASTTFTGDITGIHIADQKSLTSLPIISLGETVFKTGDTFNLINSNEGEPLVLTVSSNQGATDTAISVNSTLLYEDISINSTILINQDDLSAQYQNKTKGTVAGFNITSTGIEKSSINITDWLNSDSMTGAAVTNVPTALSVKNYVDNSHPAEDQTLAEVLVNGNVTGGTNISVNDNDKITFGASADLQIYHDQNNSYINEIGVGNLYLKATSLILSNSVGSNYLIGNSGSGVDIYFNGIKKLATTNTGISITGGGVFSGQVTIPAVPVATTDSASKIYVDTQVASIPKGLSYQGTWNASTNTPTIVSGVGVAGYYWIVNVEGTTTIDGISDWKVGDWIIFSDGGVYQKIDQSEGDTLQTVTTRGATSNQAITLSAALTGTTATFSGNVTLDNTKGIIWSSGGASSIASTNDVIKINGYSGVQIYSAVSTADTVFVNNQSGELMRLKGTGNLLLGTTSDLGSPYILQIESASTSSGTTLNIENGWGESNKSIRFSSNGTTEVAKICAYGRNNASYPPYFLIKVNDTVSGGSNLTTSSDRFKIKSDGTFIFNTVGASQKMILTSGGNLGLGTSSPVAQYDKTFHIKGTNPTVRIETDNSSGWAFNQFVSPEGVFSLGINEGENFVITNHATLGSSYVKFLISSSGNTTLYGLLTGTTGIFTGLVSGITPTSANNFATKSYVDAQVGASDTLEEVTANGNSTSYGIEFTSTNFSFGAAKIGLFTNNVMYQRGGSGGLILSNSDGAQNLGFIGNYIRWETGSAEKMRLDSAGRLGVGLTNPSGLIHAKQTANDARIIVETDSNGSNSAGAYFEAKSEYQDYHGLGLFSGTSPIEKWFIGSFGSSYFSIINGKRNDGTKVLNVTTDNRVGIGTVNPAYPLDIVGFANSTNGFRVTDGTIDNRISWASGNVGFFGTISNHSIAFYTGGNERARITSGGNLLLNTTTDLNSTLQINGRADLLNGNALRFFNSGNSNWSQITSSSSGVMAFNTGGVVNSLYLSNSGGIAFGGVSNYGTSGQVLKSNANASPTWVDASSVIGGPYLPLTGGTLTGDLILGTTASPIDLFLFGDSTGVSLTWSNQDDEFQFSDNAKATFGDSGDLQIYHQSSASYIRDLGAGNLNIQSDGVGIFLEKTDGANMAVFRVDSSVELFYNASKKFETTNTGISITGNATLTGSLTGTTATFSGNVTIQGNDLDLNNGVVLHRITNDTTNLLIRADYNSASNNSAIKFSVDNSNKMQINASGSVLIGTTSDLGSMLNISQASTSNHIRLQRTGVLPGDGIIAATSTGISISNTSFAPKFFVGTDANTKNISYNQLTVKLVPVDNSDAASKSYVDAHGGGLGPFLPLTGGTLTGGLTGTTGSFSGKITISDNQYLSWSTNSRIVANSSYMQFQVAATDKMRILANGNVGISTTSPIAKIHAIQTATGEGLRIDGANGGFALLVNGGTSYKTSIKNASIGNSYGGNTAPANGLIVEGLVGIGTTTPQSQIHIYKSTSGGVGGELRLDNNNLAVANKTRIVFSDGGGASNSFDRGAIVCQTESSPYMGQLQFQTGIGYVSTKMTILGNGNILMGTATDLGYKLNVSGLSIFKRGSGTTPSETTANSTIAVFQNNENTTDYSTIALISGTNGSSELKFGDSNDENAGFIGYNNLYNTMSFRTNGSGEDMRLTSGGDLLLGSTSDDGSNKLQVNGGIKSSSSITAAFFTTDTARGFKQNSVSFEGTYSDGSSANAANDLGSSSNQWRNIYLSGNITASTATFSGLVSGINPVGVANFATKGYVDAHGGGLGPFLPLTGGTLTGSLTGTSATFSGDIILGNRFTLGDNGVMTWGNSNNYGQLNWDGDYALISGQSGKGLKFRTNGSGTRLVITPTTGNVLIGSTSDNGQKLQVTGNVNISSSDAKTVTISNTFANTATSLSTIRAFYALGIPQLRSGNNNGLFISNVTGNRTGIQSVDANNNAIGIAIQPFGGNLLIGTTTDSGYKLDVNGQGFFGTGLVTNTAIALKLKQASGVINDSTEFRTGAGEFKIFSGRYNNAHQSFVWATGNNYVSGATRMTLTSGGNLGLGTTNPDVFQPWQRNLVVGSGVYDAGITIYHGSGSGNQGALCFADGNTGDSRYRGVISYNGADEMMFFTSAAEKMRLTSGGNLLLGTTTDSGEKLQVNGSVLVDNGDIGIDINKRLILRHDDVNASYLTYTNVGSQRTILHGFYGIEFSTQNGPALNITQSRNVIIGNTSDNGAKLQVNGNLTAISSSIVAYFRSSGGTSYVQGAISLESSNSDTPEARGQGVFMFNQGKDSTWYMGTRYNNADEWQIGRADGTSLATLSATTQKAFLKINNVGAATFASDVSIAEKLIHTGDANTYIQFASTNDKIILHTNGGNALTINALQNATFSGSLTGTSATFNGNLKIQSPSTAGFANISSDNNGPIFSGNGDNQFYTNNAVYVNRFFSANKASVLAQINNNGNFLLNSTSDNGQKLQVTGNVRITGSFQVANTGGFLLADTGGSMRYGLKYGAAGAVGSSNLLMLTNRSLSSATGGGEVAIAANASTTGVTETEVMRIKANTQSQVSIDGVLSLTSQNTPADPPNRASTIWLDSNYDLKIKITNNSGVTVTKTLAEYS